MIRCTVFGASGFIGQALTRALVSAGYEVYTPGRDERPDPALDLGHVFYCIGMTADFRSRPFDTVRAHVSLLSNLLEHYRFQSMLYLSSTRVYAGADFTDEGVPLIVNPNDSSDLYNLSKLTGEAICLHSGRPNCRVARLSNVVGFDPHTHNFYAALVREALSGGILLQSASSSEKDYILLSDAVKLLVHIGLQGHAPIYNVASGVNLTHERWCDALSRVTGCTVGFTPNAREYRFPLIDIGRIRREFGFTPVPVLEGVPDLVEEFRKYLNQ
ncbi:NAD-dependent epimerase/dehydratase family protein [Castellaniella ginsengisoli]|uniref:NAD(P)-dependent oxidoreductase n=1 Tax=Castellaniella ginsengisoli TaxID=546114 RepID=A0AB39D5V1_9BURK